jgi:hypothetical protein
MGIKKFIKSVRESLDIQKIKVSNKKKSLKIVLKKLIKRKQDLKKNIKQNSNKELKEELDIILIHIKKGKKILEKLYKD